MVVMAFSSTVMLFVRLNNNCGYSLPCFGFCQAHFFTESDNLSRYERGPVLHRGTARRPAVKISSRVARPAGKIPFLRENQALAAFLHYAKQQIPATTAHGCMPGRHVKARFA